MSKNFNLLGKVILKRIFRRYQQVLVECRTQLECLILIIKKELLKILVEEISICNNLPLPQRILLVSIITMKLRIVIIEIL